jgi:aminopeptidase N
MQKELPMQARHYPTVIIHTKRRSGIRKRRHAVLAALAAFHLMVTAAAADREVVACQYAAAGGEGESATAEPQRRHYAPDREVDVLHLTIDVTPDFGRRRVAGETTLRFAPIGHPLSELRLDAVDLTVSSVEASAEIAGYQVTEEEIVVTFTAAIPVGAVTEVTIAHAAEPKEKGLYFRTPENGYPEEDLHLFTQGEMHEHPHWFPSFDYPNERFTSEVICRVSPDLVVISNGRLVSEEVDPATGLKAARWVQEKPHVNYLIALVAGRMKSIEDRHRDIPLSFYTPASQIDQAANSFEETAAMMAFFEAEFGVPYPWVDYKQAAVDGFPHGAMENTTLTILTTRTLFTNATENVYSSRNLIAHELAHQWFGDYLTCKDWSHVWLNEGFATYYAHLYEGQAGGPEQLLYLVYRDAGDIFGYKDSRPIVYRGFGDPEDQFDYRAYPKGGWVLRMLRAQLGDELFRRCIRTYVERHALSSVVTEDLNTVIEELSGRSYDQFFDQWTYHGRHPELQVKYSWQEGEKLAKVSVTQTQTLSDSVLLFSVPTKIGFVTAGTVVYRDIEISDQHHDFYFKLDRMPDIVRFDPGYGLLAKVKFDKPTDMLYAQLEDGADVVGRLLAVEALRSKSDGKTVEKLRTALNGDAFYGVRVEASGALREIHTPAALRALIASMEQDDARVRRRVVADAGGFFRKESLEKSREVLEGEEENPAVTAQAIRNLGRYGSDEQTRKILGDYLKSSSYRNELAEAAIAAIRQRDDPSFADPLRRVLASRRANFTSTGFGRGLKALAYIARNEENREREREFLAGYVNDARESTRIAAIVALGTLRDPQSIPVVSSFAGGGGGVAKDAMQRAADAALKKLRDARAVPVELGALRDDMLELKEENEKLREDLEDLTKRFEAREAGGEQAGGDH